MTTTQTTSQSQREERPEEIINRLTLQSLHLLLGAPDINIQGIDIHQLTGLSLTCVCAVIGTTRNILFHNIVYA